MALVSPVLPTALRKVDIPNAAKIPPKINQSHIAVLGVRRGMRFAGSQFSVCSIRLSMFPEVMTAPVAFSMGRGVSEKCVYGHFVGGPANSAAPRLLRMEEARKRAAEPFRGLRFHDLRHQAITEMAEAGASDATIMALAGHLDRAMMEHYSHVRMAAKREVLSKLESGLMEAAPVEAQPTAEKVN